MCTTSFINIFLTTVLYLQTNEDLLRGNQLPLLFFHSPTNAKKLWTMGVRSVQYSSIFATLSRINHFCTKLLHLQVNPFLLRWIHNFLSSRTQSCSSVGWYSIYPAAMQWFWSPPRVSIGTLLFPVYIDGVSNSALHSKIAMYADDIALYTCNHQKH